MMLLAICGPYGLGHFGRWTVSPERYPAADGPEMTAPLFHLSLLVDDLAAADEFYCGVLGCTRGRSAERWIDIDFFGHQLSLHLGRPADIDGGVVDGDDVPMPHFGVILDLASWRALADRLSSGGIGFVAGPSSRFIGEPFEQATFFVVDPAGNHIEIKGVAADRDLVDTSARDVAIDYEAH